MDYNDAIAKAEYNTTELYAKLQALTAEKIEALKPHKESVKKALTFVPENMYYAYALAMQKGKYGAKGTYTISKKETIILDKSLREYMGEFLNQIGIETASIKGTDTFTQTLIMGVSGLVKSRKLDKGLTSLREKSDFADIFIRAFIDLGINKGVLIEDANHNLTNKYAD